MTTKPNDRYPTEDHSPRRKARRGVRPLIAVGVSSVLAASLVIPIGAQQASPRLAQRAYQAGASLASIADSPNQYRSQHVTVTGDVVQVFNPILGHWSFLLDDPSTPATEQVLVITTQTLNGRVGRQALQPGQRVQIQGSVQTIPRSTINIAEFWSGINLSQSEVQQLAGQVVIVADSINVVGQSNQFSNGPSSQFGTGMNSQSNQLGQFGQSNQYGQQSGQSNFSNQASQTNQNGPASQSVFSTSVRALASSPQNFAGSTVSVQGVASPVIGPFIGHWGFFLDDPNTPGNEDVLVVTDQPLTGANAQKPTIVAGGITAVTGQVVVPNANTVQHLEQVTGITVSQQAIQPYLGHPVIIASSIRPIAPLNSIGSAMAAMGAGQSYQLGQSGQSAPYGQSSQFGNGSNTPSGQFGSGMSSQFGNGSNTPSGQFGSGMSSQSNQFGPSPQSSQYGQSSQMGQYGQSGQPGPSAQYGQSNQYGQSGLPAQSGQSMTSNGMTSNGMSTQPPMSSARQR